MAVKNINLPKCDVCGEFWLPDKRLPDGSLNPARENPRLSKRCGKCKTPRWNEKERSSKKVGQRHTEHQKSNEELRKVESARHRRVPNGAGLLALYGILEKEFKTLGGGEAFLKVERDWGPDVWERYEIEEKKRKEHGK